jgi:hypothetical protein
LFCVQNTVAPSAAAAVNRFDLSVLHNFWDGGDTIKSFHPHCVHTMSTVLLPEVLIDLFLRDDSKPPPEQLQLRTTFRVHKYLARGIQVHNPLDFPVALPDAITTAV